MAAASLLGGAALALVPVAALAQAKEQLIPGTFHWTGPYAASASGVTGGMLDYLQMLNERDGGINGVRFVWRNCTSEHANAPGAECRERLKNADPTGATTFRPEIVFPLIAPYQDHAAAMVRYIGEEEGGLDRLRGRKIALLHHDSAYGREPVPMLENLAEKYGYELVTLAVPHPGSEQQAQWIQIRELRPDWVVLWGWGAMNPTALQSAAKIGYPRGRMVGAGWSSAEEDVIPAGDAAKEFVAAGFNVAGDGYPVIREIRRYVYGDGHGARQDASRIGSIYYNRGVVLGIVTAEALRLAQRRFGKGRPVSAEQVQWALEHLPLDARRLAELGAAGFMPPLRTRCADHPGAGGVRFMRWDGERWNLMGDWMAPLADDHNRVKARQAESAMQYAKGKGVTPPSCDTRGLRAGR